jgi:hypothetical protein
VRLAAKTHRLYVIGPIHLALCALGVFGSNFAVLLPSVTGLAGVPFGLMVVLADCIMLSFSVNGAWPESRLVAVRSPSGILVKLLLLLIGPPVVVSIAFALADIGQGPYFFGIFGWLFTVQLVVGILINATYQAVGPALYVVICALFGRIGNQVQPWAWPLAHIDGWTAFVIGGGSLLVALGLLVLLQLHSTD